MPKVVKEPVVTISDFLPDIGKGAMDEFKKLPIGDEAAKLLQDFCWRYICKPHSAPTTTRDFAVSFFEEIGRTDSVEMVNYFQRLRDEAIAQAGFILVTDKYQVLHLRMGGSPDWVLPVGLVGAEEEHLDAARRWLYRYTGVRLRGSTPTCRIKRGNVQYYIAHVSWKKDFEGKERDDDVAA